MAAQRRELQQTEDVMDIRKFVLLEEKTERLKNEIKVSNSKGGGRN